MRLSSSQTGNSRFQNFDDLWCRPAACLQVVRKAKYMGEGLPFLSPLSHLSLTKVVKCLLICFVISDIYTQRVKRTGAGKSACPSSHPPPLLQQSWEQNPLPCHGQPEFMSLLRSKDKKVTLFDEVNSDTGVKEHGQVKGERGDEQGGKDVQRKATRSKHW